MDDPPLQQNYYTYTPEGGGAWSAPQSNGATIAAQDNTAQENWTDFMRWDPSQSPQSLPPGQTLGNNHALLNRRPKTQLTQMSLGLQDQMFTSGPEDNVDNAAFTFGEDSRGMNAFDFDFASLTSAPDMLSMTRPVEPEQLWQQQRSPTENGDFNGIPPAALKVETSLSNIALSTSSRSSVERTPNSAADPQITPPSSNSSPEPRPVNTKKRKSTDMMAEGEKPGKKNAKHQPVKKTAHNMIEKRYRTKLNDKIEELKNSVPSLKRMSSTGFDDDDEEDLDGLTPAHKTNKATVLAKATEYIKHLEKRNKQLMDEMSAMKAEMEKYKKVALTAAVPFNNVTTPDGNQFQEDPFGSNPPSTPGPHLQPQGMIPVPESMMNLHAAGANQPHYARAYPAYTSAPRSQGTTGQPMVQMRGGQPFNKFMVGALAGLMILEGLSERESGEKSESRGLFSLPVHLLGRRSSGLHGYSSPYGSSMSMLQLIKAFLLLGAFIYLIYPIFEFKPKSKKKPISSIRLSPIPSLASPIEVRQKAWLTAIQTVWVPHHNFFYELAALCLKMVKLSTRRIIGWRGYVFLTGTTKEQEEARVKAWKIALDAQLMGGDAEISISRLILTLMASGTLPDTPSRLMLKAMHIRVLLWEVAKAGYGRWYMFDEFCARLSRRYWNAARAEHNLNVNSGSRSRVKVSEDNSDEQGEQLPDHLAALLMLECDEVLKDGIVQRAYNLAWNKPSAEHAEQDDAADRVVEDFGISSPLDALAAWWSSHMLKKALMTAVSTPSVTPSDAMIEEVELAVKTAPVHSTSYTRALVARAVLLEEDREAHIDAAMAVLPYPLRTKSLLENEVSAAPVSGDIMIALTLAKCLSLLQCDTEQRIINAEARAKAIAVIESAQLLSFSWTLLSFVAAYKTLNVLTGEGGFVGSDVAAQRAAEKLAGSLRLWIGREEGTRLGLSKGARGRVVERCLALRKMLVGIKEEDEREKESGYGSSED